MNSLHQIRRELCQTYIAMGSSGLIFLAAGNVSARQGDGMLISPAGASVASITPEAFVECDLSGRATDGKPSSEWAMHSAIYEAFPHAQAVVHTHSNYCVAMAATGEPLPAFHYMVAAFGGDDVRCTPYVPWATSELAKAAVVALEGRTACLLGNHGMISHGKSLQAAFNAALRLEMLCMQYVLARQAGVVKTLSAEHMRSANMRYASYG
ncbi:class II aldolase/adducin family protein [Mesorhizobium sp. J428]|uniref:class II aldolase/adducin family protein n=1 Tax=Mesorhizobium sp. J428 TaxID=2898440 RepID=UPI0021510C50|nr:class II aldolase/adducin family protein [Mesorhizobium sp. J428]MCR5856270.1 class II aldolase/adducin family protein [Mesorhizobium sp. J428]